MIAETSEPKPPRRGPTKKLHLPEETIVSRLLNTDATTAELAKEYGCSKSQIKKIFAAHAGAEERRRVSELKRVARLRRCTVTKAQALADLKRVASEMGRAPTYLEYSERGRWHAATLRTACGDARWSEVVRMAGFEPYKGGRAADGSTHQLYSNSDIFNDIRRIARDLGRHPTQPEYQRLGKYHVRNVLRRFDNSWKAAIKAAGLVYRHHRRAELKLKDQALRDDLRRVAGVVGREYPLQEEYRQHGAHDVTTYYRRCKEAGRPRKWHEVLSLFLGVRREELGPIPLTERPREYLISMIHNLKQEIRRLRRKLDGEPDVKQI